MLHFIWGSRVSKRKERKKSEDRKGEQKTEIKGCREDVRDRLKIC